MRKSKYLILSGLYFNFNNNLTNIKNVKKSFENQNILDLERFIKITNIKFDFEFYNLNFIYLHKNIESLDEYVFMTKKIQILDLSNCIKLKYIGVDAFNTNKIKQLKLPNNIETLSFASFAYNKIQNLDLSNCIKLTRIMNNAFSNNPLKTIKILNDIEIEYNDHIYYFKDPWNKFAKYYSYNERYAGDYKYENDEWKWYPL